MALASILGMGRSSRAGANRSRTGNGGTRCGVLAAAAVVLAAWPMVALAGGSDGGRDRADRCRKPLPGGLYSVDVVQEGVHRPLQVWIPAGYQGRPIPLLFFLHGSGTTGEQAMATRDAAGQPLFPNDADEHGYAVATPSGAVPFNPAPGFSGFAWNIPGVPLVGTTIYPPASTLDDVAYIGLAIDAIGETLCIDEQRVYASGASGGGRMASQLACDLSDRIAAIAPIMGVRAPLASDTPPQTADCRPSRPVPVVAIHGLLDPVNVFADADPRLVPGSSWTYGVPEAMRRWARLNGCSLAEPRRRSVTEHVERVSYRGCRANGRVELYEVADGGHTIPGSLVVPALIPLIGPTNQELDTPDTIWSFLSRHRLVGRHDEDRRNESDGD
ncbi:MAG: hypothetical protein IPK00_17360 [Deltaproteobacteria bacterium]|nr:hypothetical protein [Deltaproteobacteria bacterium]